MRVIENGIVVPYAISLQDIQKNKNANYERLLYSCQVAIDAGEDQLREKELMVALNWNCSIKFEGFSLPVVVRVYMHDHFMQFNDKKDDFLEVVSAVRNSFYKMKKQWQIDMKDSVIGAFLKDGDEEVTARIVNDILSKAEYYGIYD